MNNRDGFTLIELLAIFIVLAIVFLITVPIVSNSIEKSRQKTVFDSVNGIKRALENYYVNYDLSGNVFNGYDCIFPDNCDEIYITGAKPISGNLSIDPYGKINGYVEYRDYIYEIDNDQILLAENAPYMEYVFDYTGGEQVFKTLNFGYYKLEAWGAQGGKALGNGNVLGTGGYGGYSTGIIYLNKNTELFINVGGEGHIGVLQGCAAGGYNGGGYGTHDGGSCSYSPSDDEASGGGGGATHIALKSGLLSSLSDDIDKILIVAGGGGGSSWSFTTGSGGGFQGGVSSQTSSNSGKQSSGFAFGQGQDASGSAGNDGVAGGGGGFYGGYANDSSGKSSGSGGSGYIGNGLLSDKYMVCFNCGSSEDYSMKTINVSDVSNISEEPVSDYAKSGDGFVKITYLGRTKVRED